MENNPVFPYKIDKPKRNHKDENDDKIKYFILDSIEYLLNRFNAIKIHIHIFCNSKKIKIYKKFNKCTNIKKPPNEINKINTYSTISILYNLLYLPTTIKINRLIHKRISSNKTLLILLFNNIDPISIGIV